MKLQRALFVGVMMTVLGTAVPVTSASAQGIVVNGPWSWWNALVSLFAPSYGTDVGIIVEKPRG